MSRHQSSLLTAITPRKLDRPCQLICWLRPHVQAAGRAQGQAAGCVEVGQALADVEARLPPSGSVATGQWQFWQDWRESVLSARTAAKLAPQVRQYSGATPLTLPASFRK